jgi:uncharacterized protein (TIGR02145 family)
VAATPNTVIGGNSTSVSANISGLKSGQIYHYTVKAVSSGGTAYGDNVTFTTSVKDYDGNIYNTVTIGTQVWLKENLKTTKYNDDTAIPNEINNLAWGGLTTPAYCWYNNDIVNKNVYGSLYNWYTVNTGKLCPTGWHVPTDNEWTVLTTYLGGESVAGSKLKETGTTHWLPPNADATNASSFTGLPGGYRIYDGTFSNIAGDGLWWTAIEYNLLNAWLRVINCNRIPVDKYYNSKKCGLSVRCLRD